MSQYNNVVWQVVGVLMLFCILLDALACEIRQRRIPTLNVVLLMVVGVLWHAVELASPGDGFFGQNTGPGGVFFAALGAVSALLICLPLVLFRLLRMSHAWLAAGVGAFAGLQAVLDVALFGGVAFVLLYTVASSAGPGYQGFLRRLANVLEHLVPGSRGVMARGMSAPAMPTSLVMTSALALYGLWIALGQSPIIRF